MRSLNPHSTLSHVFVLIATAAPTLAEPWSSGTRVGVVVCNPRERRGVTLRNDRRIKIPAIRQADEPSPGGGQSPPDASPWAEARFAREKGGISLGARWAAPGGSVLGSRGTADRGAL